MTWDETFNALFAKCLALYQSGNRDFASYYASADLSFLASIGYKQREFFDFIEDLADEGLPAQSTALLIASVRRDYFQVIQESKPSLVEITAKDLPTFGDKIEEFVYLPRIIKKAHHKLRGELDPDLMYGCGGDRNFLSKNGNIHPADFLRHVWAYNADEKKIAGYVRTFIKDSH